MTADALKPERRTEPGALDRHYHECGYCGHFFPVPYDKVADTPCSRCRSRKKACDCRAQRYKP